MSLTPALRSGLESRLKSEVRFEEPLARYSTYRIGGPARAVVLPQTVADVVAATTFAREQGISWLALGLGSNLLISDRGFDGIVIRIGKGLDRVERSGPEGHLWSVGAGLPTPLLARQSAAAGHGGAQRLIGVPGTVGGGIFMNAGAHGQDFSLITRSVDVIESDGKFRTIPSSQVSWRYRSSGLEGVVVVGGTFALEPGDPEQTRDELASYLKKRREGTPFDEPCCGSVFRNPAGPVSGAAGQRTAGQLIEACGLKGFRVGGAEVSPKHANYIVNLGTATAADVQGVIGAVRERVHREFGVALELEVKLIG